MMLVRHASRSAGSRLAVKLLSTWSSPWADYPMAPVDPIIGLNEIFKKDTFEQKVIVGVGAYRDDQGKPYVLPCVREAEKILQGQQLDHEYSGIVSNLPPRAFDLCCAHCPIAHVHLLLYII